MHLLPVDWPFLPSPVAVVSDFFLEDSDVESPAPPPPPMLSLIRSVRRQFREWAHRGHAEPDRFDIDWYAIPYNRIATSTSLLSNQVEGRYLEIGCFWNALFDAVMARHKTGVDPVRGGTHRMPSDDYFRTHPGEDSMSCSSTARTRTSRFAATW